MVIDLEEEEEKGVKMDIREMLEKIGKAKWFEKEILPYDIQYHVIGLNTRSYPSEFIDSLPKFGNRFYLVDIRKGKRYGAYMNIKQYQISSLDTLWRNYPNMMLGNIIRIAISPENKNEVWVDFKYQEEADKKAEIEKRKAADKEKNKKHNIFLQDLKRKDVEYRKLVKERIRYSVYNDICTGLRQSGLEEIEKRNAEQKTECAGSNNGIGDNMMRLTLIDAEEVVEDPTYAPVLDAEVVGNYNRLIEEGKLKLYIYDLFAGEVNYGSFSVPRDYRYNEILAKSQNKSIMCGDLKTGWRRKSHGKMRDQQFWLNGLMDYWREQYPGLIDIAELYKGKGEKGIKIGKKLFGIIESEGVLELVFAPISEIADKKLKEEADKKAKDFNECKKGLKESDLRRKYEEFKKELKEIAAENLKRRREEIANIVADGQEHPIEEVERSKQTIIYDEKSVKQMNEDTVQRIKQMNEDTVQRIKQMNENIVQIIQRMNENTVQRVQKMVEDSKLLKSVESEKMRTKEKSSTGKIEYHKHNTMDNTMTGASLRTNIFEIISGLSKENKKCSNTILINNLYKMGYQNYYIYSALNLLEKGIVIYKIIYIDWFVKEKYRDDDIDTDNKLRIDIFEIIKNFSKKYNWNRGIKRTDLYDELLKKGHLENEIGPALESMKKQDMIYNKTYIYWFTNEYKGHIKEEIIEEAAEEVAEENIIEFPENTEFQTKVTILESQNIALQTKVTTLESQNATLQTKVTTLESQVDPKRERQLTDDEKSLMRGRNEVELSIEKQLRELKKDQQDQERFTLLFNNARLDAMNIMNDLYKKIDTQDLIGYRLEIAEIGNKEIMEHIQKTINDLGYRTELYKVDVMKKRKDVKVWSSKLCMTSLKNFGTEILKSC